MTTGASPSARRRLGEAVQSNLVRTNFFRANLKGVQKLDKGIGLSRVRSWRGANIGRKWVACFGLDAKQLGLEVVDDLDDAT